MRAYETPGDENIFRLPKQRDRKITLRCLSTRQIISQLARSSTRLDKCAKFHFSSTGARERLIKVRLINGRGMAESWIRIGRYR